MTTTLTCSLIEHFDTSTLATACQIDENWILERARAGLLHDAAIAAAHHTFNAQTLKRIQRMRTIERNFDANPELAALVADLLERIDVLNAQKAQIDCIFEDI